MRQKTSAEEFAELVMSLFVIAQRCSDHYEEIRILCTEIAGCSLDDWDLDYVERYADLAP